MYSLAAKKAHTHSHPSPHNWTDAYDTLPILPNKKPTNWIRDPLLGTSISLIPYINFLQSQVACAYLCAMNCRSCWWHCCCWGHHIFRRKHVETMRCVCMRAQRVSDAHMRHGHLCVFRRSWLIAPRAATSQLPHLFSVGQVQFSCEMMISSSGSRSR